MTLDLESLMSHPFISSCFWGVLFGGDLLQEMDSWFGMFFCCFSTSVGFPVNFHTTILRTERCSKFRRREELRTPERGLFRYKSQPEDAAGFR
jgi:hypothetical protein